MAYTTALHSALFDANINDNDNEVDTNNGQNNDHDDPGAGACNYDFSFDLDLDRDLSRPTVFFFPATPLPPTSSPNLDVRYTDDRYRRPSLITFRPQRSWHRRSSAPPLGALTTTARHRAASHPYAGNNGRRRSRTTLDHLLQPIDQSVNAPTTSAAQSSPSCFPLSSSGSRRPGTELDECLRNVPIHLLPQEYSNLSSCYSPGQGSSSSTISVPSTPTLVSTPFMEDHLEIPGFDDCNGLYEPYETDSSAEGEEEESKADHYSLLGWSMGQSVSAPTTAGCQSSPLGHQLFSASARPSDLESRQRTDEELCELWRVTMGRMAGLGISMQ